MDDIPPVLHVRLPPELRLALEAAAKKADRSVSYLVRAAIVDWLRQHGKRAA